MMDYLDSYSEKVHLCIMIETMKAPLTLLIDEEVQRYLDYYIECFDIRIALFDSSGRSLRAGKQRDNCEFCCKFRGREKYDRLCLSLDSTMRKRVLTTQKTEFYRCHAGLWEAVRAIKVEGILMGYAMVGQIKIDEEMNFMESDHPLREELKSIYLKIPLQDKNKMPAMIGLFDALVEFMVQKNFMKVRTDIFAGKILGFIEDNLNQPLSLRQGAAFMNMTPQALAHSIRRHGLEPFTTLMQKRKISEAQNRLNKDPQLSIKELSHALGFKDQYYFSRVFKKYCGKSPSHYRL